MIFRNESGRTAQVGQKEFISKQHHIRAFNVSENTLIKCDYKPVSSAIPPLYDPITQYLKAEYVDQGDYWQETWIVKGISLSEEVIGGEVIE